MSKELTECHTRWWAHQKLVPEEFLSWSSFLYLFVSSEGMSWLPTPELLCQCLSVLGSIQNFLGPPEGFVIAGERTAGAVGQKACLRVGCGPDGPTPTCQGVHCPHLPHQGWCASPGCWVWYRDDQAEPWRWRAPPPPRLEAGSQGGVDVGHC